MFAAALSPLVTSTLPRLNVMDLDRLINRHKDAVYRQMVRTCGNRVDAEDALADAIYAALKASDQLRDPTNFQAWLAKIGTRACIRMRIRERLVTFAPLADLEAAGIELPDPGAGPASEAELSAVKHCVTGALEMLPEIYRVVYTRREILGEPAQAVATDLGITLPAVKSRLLRARSMMRDLLDSGLGCRDMA